MHETLTFTILLLLFMLFIDNKFSLMNAIHMAAHDYLPVYTETISFDSSEKSLCAGVTGNLAPPKFGPPGPNFLGNMAPPGAIFPRKFGPHFGNLAPLHKHGC